MNRQITRIITGLAIIGVGILALLNALNITTLNALFEQWWPLLVILAGALMFINHPRQFVWPLVVTTGGLLLQLRELHIVTFNVWGLFWPIIIIAVGLSVLINRSTHPNTNKSDLDEASSLLGGNAVKNESKDYRGGNASAIMGGVDLDLRDAIIKKEATLNVFAFWGGITLKVPEGWAVKSKITPVAGGVDIKTKPAEKEAPVLYLTGDVIMGGVEVKHF
jgi:predicted membrane protein